MKDRKYSRLFWQPGIVDFFDGPPIEARRNRITGRVYIWCNDDEAWKRYHDEREFPFESSPSQEVAPSGQTIPVPALEAATKEYTDLPCQLCVSVQSKAKKRDCKEGYTKKGGVNPAPTTSKPDVTPGGVGTQPPSVGSIIGLLLGDDADPEKIKKLRTEVDEKYGPGTWAGNRFYPFAVMQKGLADWKARNPDTQWGSTPEPTSAKQILEELMSKKIDLCALPSSRGTGAFNPDAEKDEGSRILDEFLQQRPFVQEVDGEFKQEQIEKETYSVDKIYGALRMEEDGSFTEVPNPALQAHAHLDTPPLRQTSVTARALQKKAQEINDLVFGTEELPVEIKITGHYRKTNFMLGIDEETVRNNSHVVTLCTESTVGNAMHAHGPTLSVALRRLADALDSCAEIERLKLDPDAWAKYCANIGLKPEFPKGKDIKEDDTSGGVEQPVTLVIPTAAEIEEVREWVGGPTFDYCPHERDADVDISILKVTDDMGFRKEFHGEWLHVHDIKPIPGTEDAPKMTIKQALELQDSTPLQRFRALQATMRKVK